MQFKVGDRVRVIKEAKGWFDKGATGTVERVADEAYSGPFLYVKWDKSNFRLEHAVGGWFAHRFEKIDELARYVVVCGTDITAGYANANEATADAEKSSKDLGEDFQVYQLMFKVETTTNSSYVGGA